jgi:hypothetical protein
MIQPENYAQRICSGQIVYRAEIVAALAAASTSASTAVLTVILLIIPNQASHGDDHRDDRPRRDCCDYSKEKELTEIFATGLCAEEFAAQFTERRQLLLRNCGGAATRFYRRLKVVIG